MTFQPLTDDIDEADDDDRSHRSDRLSPSHAIPIQRRPEYRTRSHSSNLDPDAMSISVPRSTLDVHMASVSSSPNVQYSRPVEFVSSSLGRVPENALGLRTAESIRTSPVVVTPEMKEQQERQMRLAQLRDVLGDPGSSPGASLSRKPTLSETTSDRARPLAPSGLSSTRTPSPVSSTSHSQSLSSLEKEQAALSQKQPLLQRPVCSASVAAFQHQQRTRASSNASVTPAPGTPATSSLSHATPTRDGDTAPLLHQIYAAPLPSPAPSPARPTQPRRQSTDTASLSKGKSAAMGMAPAGTYQSGLTRSMRAMQEAQRVS
ncbi:hypothetical protein BV20DRAFT_131497 [Pilatotrama ljubarskyi]|nr:hypothetical protein BV20DRAFT_131497 [Pilatotrama ljubarskyi]